VRISKTDLQVVHSALGMPASDASCSSVAAVSCQGSSSSPLTEIPWSHWMISASCGDDLSYNRLLQASIPLVFRVGELYGLDEAKCDDLVQDVLITLHMKRNTYDPSESFIGWLWNITSRCLYVLARREQVLADTRVSLPANFNSLQAGRLRLNDMIDNKDWLHHATQALLHEVDVNVRAKATPHLHTHTSD
jgi:DNA-directed RNA polymerase specialized sigma24 family protein